MKSPVAGISERDATKLPRRKFLHLAAGAAALPAVSRFACAQAYPSRPVRIIVGFPAGSGPDIIARLIGQGFSERLGHQFVIENRPGCSGQYCHRNRRESAVGRLYASTGERSERCQRDALREA